MNQNIIFHSKYDPSTISAYFRYLFNLKTLAEKGKFFCVKDNYSCKACCYLFRYYGKKKSRNLKSLIGYIG